MFDLINNHLYTRKVSYKLFTPIFDYKMPLLNQNTTQHIQKVTLF